MEAFIRADAWGFADSEEPHRELLVLEDDGEGIVAVCALERFPGEDRGFEWFINAVAVRSDQQGNGFGLRMLVSVLALLRERSPGLVATWHVHVENHASQKMCEKLENVEAEHPPELRRSRLMLYIADL